MGGAAVLMYTVARHPGGFAEVMREAREGRVARAAAKVRVAADDTDEAPVLPRLPHTVALRQRPAHDAGVPVLQVKSVTVRFGGLIAVDDASLTVRRGQIVGLIGPNGAGKTTLFNSISGVLRPRPGRVHLLGQDVSDLPSHQRARLGLARTFQHIGLAKNQTVLDNLLLAQHQLTGYAPGRALLRTPR